MFMRMWGRSVVVVAVLAVSVLLGRPLSAASLADKTPDDALFFAQWAGAQAQGEKFQQSHLKKLLDEMDFQSILDDVLPRLMMKAENADDEIAAVIQVAGAIATPMWKYPTAIYFGPVEIGERGPMPRIALMCDAGADAEDLTNELRALIARMGRTPVPVSVNRFGGPVIVSVGVIPQATLALWGSPVAVAPAKPLAQHPRFTAAAARVMPEPALLLYVNVRGMLQQVDAVVADGPERDRANWAKVIQSSGLDSVESAIFTAGFDGKDWGSQAFIAAPAPRKGLVKAFIDSSPLTDDMLAMIPASATVAGGGRFDPAAIFAEVRNVIASVDERAARNIDRELNELRDEVLGIHLEQDLLAALGDQWVYFTDPDAGGQGLLGIVLVNKLRDPERMSKSLFALGAKANEALARLTPEDIQIRFRQGKANGEVVSYLGTPLLAPSYVIKGDKLILSLFPQTAAAAANPPAKSIAENPAFKQFRQRLGGRAHSGFLFMDLPRTAPGSYQVWMLLGRGLTGLCDILGAQAPLTVPPALNRITPMLSPAGSITWTDDAGLHIRSITPFPMASLLSNGGVFDVVMTSLPLQAAVLIPALSHARATARQVQGASNLRQIGMGMHMYTNENRGRFPPDLGAIIEKGYIESPEVFVRPGSPVPVGLKPAELAQWVNKESHVVYLGAGKRVARVGPDEMVAYETPDRPNKKVNVLFGDGHVEAVSPEEFEQLLNKAKKN